jgi:uncharacterized membrane protein
MVLIAVVAVSVIGLAFYIVFPEIRFIRSSSSPIIKDKATSDHAKGNATPKINLTASSSACEVLLKTMTPEEQKVLNVLMAHQGKYLQKYVSKEAGLSRLRTHRIIARFAQRGIVTVKQFGNSNEVLLAEWVKPTA